MLIHVVYEQLVLLEVGNHVVLKDEQDGLEVKAEIAKKPSQGCTGVYIQLIEFTIKPDKFEFNDGDIMLVRPEDIYIEL